MLTDNSATPMKAPRGGGGKMGPPWAPNDLKEHPDHSPFCQAPAFGAVCQIIET